MDSDSPDTTTPVAGTATREISPPSSESPDDNENYTRARLSAILYF